MAYNSAYTGPQVDSAVGQVVGENIPAGSVKFTDGQTFQQKYDAGQLTGPQGPAGENGATGPQGEPGQNATINGVNALTLTVTGGGITGTQTGSTFTLDSTELFQSVSDGKTLIAGAITDKGVSTSASDSFQTMADNIAAIETGGGATEKFFVTLETQKTWSINTYSEGQSVSFNINTTGWPIEIGTSLVVYAKDADGNSFEITWSYNSFIGAVSISFDMPNKSLHVVCKFE